jgi:hypothetical protein
MNSIIQFICNLIHTQSTQFVLHHGNWRITTSEQPKIHFASKREYLIVYVIKLNSNEDCHTVIREVERKMQLRLFIPGTETFGSFLCLYYDGIPKIEYTPLPLPPPTP